MLSFDEEQTHQSSYNELKTSNNISADIMLPKMGKTEKDLQKMVNAKLFKALRPILWAQTSLTPRFVISSAAGHHLLTLEVLDPEFPLTSYWIIR